MRDAAQGVHRKFCPPAEFAQPKGAHGSAGARTCRWENRRDQRGIDTCAGGACQRSAGVGCRRHDGKSPTPEARVGQACLWPVDAIGPDVAREPGVGGNQQDKASPPCDPGQRPSQADLILSPEMAQDDP